MERVVCGFGKADFVFTFQTDWVQTYVPFDCNVAFGQWSYSGLDMVQRVGDRPFWNCRVESHYKVEGERIIRIHAYYSEGMSNE